MKKNMSVMVSKDHIEALGVLLRLLWSRDTDRILSDPNIEHREKLFRIIECSDLNRNSIFSVEMTLGQFKAAGINEGKWTIVPEFYEYLIELLKKPLVPEDFNHLSLTAYDQIGATMQSAVNTLQEIMAQAVPVEEVATTPKKTDENKLLN